MKAEPAEDQVRRDQDPLLTSEQLTALQRQDARPVTTFMEAKFRKDAKKNWDLFYKRNEDRFFKDRHWTTREFLELAKAVSDKLTSTSKPVVLLEVGCGAGNFLFPLLDEAKVSAAAAAASSSLSRPERTTNLFVFACDFSPRAVELVKSHPSYDESCVKAFVADVSQAGECSPLISRTSAEEGPEPGPGSEGLVPPGEADLATLMFVLSALAPDRFLTALLNVSQALRPGSGLLLFRDYAVNDAAMFRFGANTKVSDRHYVRQDGTFSYFFDRSEVVKLAEEAGFEVLTLEYVKRKTVNKQEGVEVARIFLQGKFLRQR